MAGSGYDIDFDQIKAMNWKREVDAEIVLVDRLLQNVGKECEQIAGDDDTFMKKFYEIGQTVQTSWKKLCNGFMDVAETLSEVAKEYQQGVSEKIDELDRFKGGFR